jgi:bleomycin hydrolase
MKYYILLIISFSIAFAKPPVKDGGIFQEGSNPMYDSIQKEIKAQEKKEKKKPRFRVDLSNRQLPKSVNDFKQIWHNPPTSQGNTGTCWSFSTTSLMESEIKRISGKEVKLSEMFIVYYEYLAKAKQFVKTRGKSTFGEGSQSDGVIRVASDYGLMPREVYDGNPNKSPFYDHSKMFTEMNNFLTSIKAQNNWNEDLVASTIKSILNFYMGEPPIEFSFKGKRFTPKSFLTEYAGINPSEYVNIISVKEAKYGDSTIYDVPDNWLKTNNYSNIALDEWVSYLRQAANDGYSIFLAGDVSEAGIDGNTDVAIIPSFDIPSEYIDEDARQFRISNNTTTDDHGIHIVGVTKIGDKYWYLIKDSGSGGFNGKTPGYFYYDEDYIKLKMLYFTIHKSAIKKMNKGL